MKKDTFILGRGGFAREVAGYIQDNNRNLSQKINVRGFLEVYPEDSAQGTPVLRVFDSIDSKTFNFQTLSEGQRFILALGDLETRKKIQNFLFSEGVKPTQFINFIHHSAFIDETACLGVGNVITPFCIIGPSVSLGDFNLVNIKSSIAHDNAIGNNNVFCPNTTLTGEVKVGDDNFFSTSVTVVPQINIGCRNKFKPAIVVLKDAADDIFVASNTKNKAFPLNSVVVQS